MWGQLPWLSLRSLKAVQTSLDAFDILKLPGFLKLTWCPA